MDRQRRREIRLRWRRGASRRIRIGLATSADYWPLTIVPSTSKPKRTMAVWIVASVVAALGAALTLAVRRAIPAW
jgi:hypothetical protein